MCSTHPMNVFTFSHRWSFIYHYSLARFIGPFLSTFKHHLSLEQPLWCLLIYSSTVVATFYSRCWVSCHCSTNSRYTNNVPEISTPYIFFMLENILLFVYSLRNTFFRCGVTKWISGWTNLNIYLLFGGSFVFWQDFGLNFLCFQNMQTQIGFSTFSFVCVCVCVCSYDIKSLCV